MSVYVITCRSLGVAKIGFSKNPEKRAELVRTYCPGPTALEAVVPAVTSNETDIHRALKEHRVHGEWFKICDEIEALIAAHKYIPLPPVRREIKAPEFKGSELAKYIAAKRGRAVEIAKKTGLSLSTITRCARGETQPKRSIAKLISSACDGHVSVDGVYGLEEAQ